MLRLLIGLDGGPDGAVALELGLRWSRRFDAMLLGLAIVDEPSIRRPEALPIGGSYYKHRAEEKLLGEARARADAILADFEKRCGLAGAAFDVLEDVGAPHERILKDAQSCDIVLLGRDARFRNATGRDTTVEAVLRHSPRPLVAVPRHLPDGEDVVIAYDGSEEAARALQAFLWLRGGDRAPVHVVSVDPEERQASEWARTAADYLIHHDIHAIEHILVSHERPEEGIVRTAQDVQAGLIVMGAYGQPRLREFLLGSVTRSLLKSSPIPLFLDP